MVTKEKVEGFILEIETPYEEIDDGLWILYESEENTTAKLVVSYSEEIIHFRMKVMDLPKDDCALFKTLLSLNATGITHGAFAIEEGSVILIDSLQTENLDFNEFQASVESLFLCLVETYDKLSQFVTTA